MSIELYPNIAKIKRNGVYQNLPGFVQQSGDADIKAMIANSESSTTAQYAHPEGSYFILNDVLYKAIINIAVNDTIAVGTNCKVAILCDDVSKIESDIDDLNNDVNEIESNADELKSTLFYDTPKYILVPFSDITEKTNTFLTGSVGNVPSENTNGMWRTMSMAVESGEKYRINARFYSSIKGAFFLDSDGKTLEIDGSESSDTLHTFSVTVPNGAVKMTVNDKKSTGFSIEKIIDVFNNDLIYIGDINIDDLLGDYADNVGTIIGNNIYSVGLGKMKTVVNLYGSNNGTVSYSRIYYNNTDFKDASDDVAPISTGGGFVGANHGWNLVYEATLTNHGFTEADIGKTCEIDGETWVLLKIKSTSVFVVGCIENNIYGLKSVSTVPTTFDFGSSVTVSSISRVQLYPSVKNINIAVTKNNNTIFEISESYDVVSLVNGIAYIIENVGNNTNTDIIDESDALITVRNLYDFMPNGSCVITQNLKVLSNQPLIAFYGGTQCGAIGGNSCHYSVPMTSNGALAPTGSEVNFYRNTWTDETKPPIIFCQADNSAISATKMMVQGVLVDNRNSMLYSMGGFISAIRKMYPYAVQPNDTVDAGTTYNIVSFRLPIYAGEMNSSFKFCQYCKVRNDYYFFCFSASAVTDSIHVPSELCGKKIETIIAENATCNNLLIADSIDVTATGESYLLLKLTD